MIKHKVKIIIICIFILFPLYLLLSTVINIYISKYETNSYSFNVDSQALSNSDEFFNYLESANTKRRLNEEELSILEKENISELIDFFNSSTNKILTSLIDNNYDNLKSIYNSYLIPDTKFGDIFYIIYNIYNEDITINVVLAFTQELKNIFFYSNNNINYLKNNPDIPILDKNEILNNSKTILDKYTFLKAYNLSLDSIAIQDNYYILEDFSNNIYIKLNIENEEIIVFQKNFE